MRKSMLITLGLLAFAAPAQAADFLFSFTSTPGAPGVGPNAIVGTATGRIIGLPEAGTGAAVQVFIDSVTGSGSFFPILASSWFDKYSNAFTVSGGQIVAADFHTDNPFGGFDRLYINYGIDGVGTNYASVGNLNAQAVWNRFGLQGVTFTRITVAVPEPASWATMLFGFGVVGCAMRKARRKFAVRTT